MSRNRPSDAELTQAVIEFLGDELQPEIDSPSSRFKLRVAINALKIVERERRLAAEYDQQETILLQKILDAEESDLATLNRLFCKKIRRGDFDDRRQELVATLNTITLNKLSIDNPRYSTYQALVSASSDLPRDLREDLRGDLPGDLPADRTKEDPN